MRRTNTQYTQHSLEPINATLMKVKIKQTNDRIKQTKNKTNETKRAQLNVISR